MVKYCHNSNNNFSKEKRKKFKMLMIKKEVKEKKIPNQRVEKNNKLSKKKNKKYNKNLFQNLLII